MNIINTVLGIPLGYILYFLYELSKNYGVAIILFTLASKLILFPVSLLVQKNSIKMVKLQPELKRVQERFAGDKDRIAEEQIKLYDAEHYSPALGCLPMLLQIPLILGLISVIYNPLQHLLHMDAATIALLTDKAKEILNLTELGSSPQMRVIALLPEHFAAFAAIPGLAPDTLLRVSSLNLHFLGLNLAEIPSVFQMSALVVLPVLSGISALLLCVYQNYENVLQREQGMKSQLGMTVFMTAFSLYFTFIVPAGVGIYWVASNLFAIVQLWILNRIMDPNQYIDYASRPRKLSPEEEKAKRETDAALKAREKADIKRFFGDDNWQKQLVVYSESNGFYKYYDLTLDYILENSGIVIHYVTGDASDKIFDRQHPRIRAYYVSDKSLASFMLKVDADIVLMTMPDLGQFHIKRSMARKDIEYVYMFHYPLSTTMVLRKGALDHYDTVFLVGAFQEAEIRQTEALYHLPQKKLVLAGYGLLEKLVKQYASMPKVERERPKLLIAPSWQMDNLLDFCADELLGALLGQGFDVVVRPHPEYVKRYGDRMDRLVKAYAEYAGNDLTFELDFTDSSSIYNSDVVISDWSGTAYEFAFITGKPAVFIDTPPKINNPEYDKIEAEPLELTLRDRIGISAQPGALSDLADRIRALLREKEAYKEDIGVIFRETIANFGRSGEISGQYIIDQIAKKGEK